jgi:hypothetical protein
MQERPDRLWGPPSLLSSGYPRWGGGGGCVKSSSELKNHGAISSLSSCVSVAPRLIAGSGTCICMCKHAVFVRGAAEILCYASQTVATASQPFSPYKRVSCCPLGDLYISICTSQRWRRVCVKPTLTPGAV